jgi:transposase-like protein
MKPRNREINIFNMSLLDILCGALGTFCFLMLVLFPFYSQDKGEAKAPEVPKQQIDPKTYEQAMARLRQLEETLKQFQEYAAQLEAKLKQMTAQTNQAQAEAQELRQQNAQLRMRNPILVLASFGPQEGNAIEIDEDDNCAVPPGKQRPPIDPAKNQGPFWTGDRSIFGSAVATYLVRDAPACQFKFFLKILKHPPANPVMQGNVLVQTGDDFQVW